MTPLTIVGSGIPAASRMVGARSMTCVREFDVDGVGLRVGVDQRVAALMQLVAVGEPHADPHRRVQRPVGEHATRRKAQPQKVRGNLAPARHGQLIVARAQQLEHRALEST
jgi:hypothetical protein